MLISQSNKQKKAICAVCTYVSAAFPAGLHGQLYGCALEGCLCACQLGYTHSFATSCTGKRLLQQPLLYWVPDSSNLQQRTYSCLHCTFLQMQIPVLSAILLLFPCVCMVALKAEVASVQQPVSCASAPEHAFAPVLPGVFPCPSRIKKG